MSAAVYAAGLSTADLGPVQADVAVTPLGMLVLAGIAGVGAGWFGLRLLVGWLDRRETVRGIDGERLPVPRRRA